MIMLLCKENSITTARSKSNYCYDLKYCLWNKTNAIYGVQQATSYENQLTTIAQNQFNLPTLARISSYKQNMMSSYNVYAQVKGKHIDRIVTKNFISICKRNRA